MKTLDWKSRLSVLGAGFVLWGCSLALETDKVQCETDQDCARGGFADSVCRQEVCQARTALGWTCLGSVQWPTGQVPEVALQLRAVQVETDKPPTGLSVRICTQKTDVNCEFSAVQGAQVGDDGTVIAKVPGGFDGYLELTGPSLTTALFFVTKPLWTDTVVPHVIPLVSTQGFQQIASAIGTSLDSNLGHVYAIASDCGDQPAAGVKLRIDQQGAAMRSFYMIGTVPLASAGATDASGSGGFLNLTPGFVELSGFVSDTGLRIGKATFVVRRGAVSYPRIVPSP